MTFLRLTLVLILAGCSARSKLIPFERGELYGYRNASGETIIEPRFMEANVFLPGGVALVLDSKWHYIDEAGRSVFDAYVYDNGPDYIEEGMSRITKNGKIGFIDASGRVRIEPSFEFVAPFSEGLAAFCEGCSRERAGEHSRMSGGLWGYINKQGNVVIEAGFQSAGAFEEGQASVKLNGETFQIDRSGRRVHAR